MEKGCKVFVANTITGAAPLSIYTDYKRRRNITFFENDISKRSSRSKLRWLFVSILHSFLQFSWRNKITICFRHVLNKGTIGLPIPKNSYDVLLINLIDALPLSVFLCKKHHIPFLIFDSQEYFTGQYAKYESFKHKWVIEAEKRNIGKAQLILGTTYEMCNRLYTNYSLKSKPLRVRNIPATNEVYPEKKAGDTLNLVWHGMSINYGNCRGVHIIVEAVSCCKTEVRLFLQGKKVESDYLHLLNDLKKYHLEDKVFILDPVLPEQIVESISKYDVGITGELPEEENQLLTSSNKLFEYIKAGLATIVPDLPGLTEIIKEFGTGPIFSAGNARELAAHIDNLNINRYLLRQYKKASQQATKELCWDRDFEQVWFRIANE
ncbi:MAG: glycosyltransferase [Bacteroidales bacterium]